jgi:hypothetical protein
MKNLIEYFYDDKINEIKRIEPLKFKIKFESHTEEKIITIVHLKEKCIQLLNDNNYQIEINQVVLHKKELYSSILYDVSNINSKLKINKIFYDKAKHKSIFKSINWLLKNSSITN